MFYVVNTPQQREVGQPTQSLPMVVNPYVVSHDIMLYKRIASIGDGAWPLQYPIHCIMWQALGQADTDYWLL